MKRMYLTTFILLVSVLTSNLFAEIIRTEYKQGINNTYKLEYTDDDYVLISNSVNPFENIPRPLWEEKIKIAGFTDNLDRIIRSIIGPYIKHLSLTEDDDVSEDMFFMSIDAGLDGTIKHIVFGLSILKQQAIPLSVIEELEAQIKQNFKFKLKYKTNDLDDVEYINFVRSYSFYFIQKKFLSMPPLLPLPDDDKGLIPNY